MHRPTALAVLALAALATACREPIADACAAPAPKPRPAAAKPVEVCEPLKALDKLDARAPVPLLPMMANHQKESMRDHLLAVQEIVAAAGVGDYARVEKAAGRIGSSDEMTRQCNHMGAGAPGFTEQALGFHKTADSIVAAARKNDQVEVLRALGTTLQSCTACHAAFKQAVVDEAGFARAGGKTPVQHVGGAR